VAATVRVHYRFHPLHGQDVRVVRRIRYGRDWCLDCEQLDGRIGGIPAWMTDPVVCAGVSVGEPLVEPAALVELREVLDALLAARTGGALVAAARAEGETDDRATPDPSTSAGAEAADARPVGDAVVRREPPADPVSRGAGSPGSDAGLHARRRRR